MEIGKVSFLLLFDQKNKLHEKTDFVFEEFGKETQRVTTIFENVILLSGRKEIFDEVDI